MLSHTRHVLCSGDGPQTFSLRFQLSDYKCVVYKPVLGKKRVVNLGTLNEQRVKRRRRYEAICVAAVKVGQNTEINLIELC